MGLPGPVRVSRAPPPAMVARPRLLSCSRCQLHTWRPRHGPCACAEVWWSRSLVANASRAHAWNGAAERRGPQRVGDHESGIPTPKSTPLDVETQAGGAFDAFAGLCIEELVVRVWIPARAMVIVC